MECSLTKIQIALEFLAMTCPLSAYDDDDYLFLDLFPKAKNMKSNATFRMIVVWKKQELVTTMCPVTPPTYFSSDRMKGYQNIYSDLIASAAVS